MVKLLLSIGVIILSFEWTEKSIENYKRASRYTAFHKKLSVLAEPYLDESWTLADIGCGLGLIDFFIAPMVASIDAIDSSEPAIADLNSRLDDEYYANKHIAEKINPVWADPETLGDFSWDVVMMNFFGPDEVLLEDLIDRAKRRVLIFTHGRQSSWGFRGAQNDDETLSADELEEFLNSRNLPFKKTVIEMQFGQPFKSIEDIHEFLNTFGGENLDEVAVKKIVSAEERIIKTNRYDFPYYLPKSISVALFIVVKKM